jgi:hypothetical protein
MEGEDQPAAFGQALDRPPHGGRGVRGCGLEVCARARGLEERKRLGLTVPDHALVSQVAQRGVANGGVEVALDRAADVPSLPPLPDEEEDFLHDLLRQVARPDVAAGEGAQARMVREEEALERAGITGSDALHAPVLQPWQRGPELLGASAHRAPRPVLGWNAPPGGRT